MSLLYVPPITREINNFLRPFGIRSTIGTDFAIWLDDDIEDCYITWSVIVVDKHDILFREYFKELGLKYECDIFLLSLLHELGHFMTHDKIPKKKLEQAIEEKKAIENKPHYTDEDYKAYYRNYEEMVASKWAVKYINSHPKEIETFWNKLQPKLMKFFEMNGLSADY